METVEFKNQSGDSYTEFNAIAVIPEYDLDITQFSDLNFDLQDVINAKRKMWTIEFGMLAESAQDFFLALNSQADPWFQYESTQYQIRVKSVNMKHTGGKIVIINREAE